MKFILLPIALLISLMSWAQTPCEGGEADGFPCNGIDLMDQLTPSQMGDGFTNDSWGWTDPDTGKEYALVGLFESTAFVDISDPTNIVLLGNLPTHSEGSIWRDIKVFNNYAFIVSEANDHGMQVFDLTRLRSVSSAPEVFTEDAHYDGFGDAHNIAINEDSGFAYAIGTDTFNGGPHIVNINDPLSPVFAGGFSASGYSHDAQIVTYDGPDTDYLDREIFFGSNEEFVTIVDVTNKNSPTLIANVDYGSTGYTHQGWLTEDSEHFILCDEVDEIDFGFETKNIVFDVSDLDNPSFDFNYFANTFSTDHNGYVVGDTWHLASYRAGYRAIDISEIDDQNMTELAYFDTVPDGDSAGTGEGAWNVYPFFESGNIVISDQFGGLFVLRSSNLSTPDIAKDGFSIYPNPAQDLLQIDAGSSTFNEVCVYSSFGQLLLTRELQNFSKTALDVSALPKGVYMIVIDNATTQKFIKS